MAEGYKARGGASRLNFKVVGNPQPANPKENTIWLNTDRKITGYFFSATQPSNMAEGNVWIMTGKASTVVFSATKKNPIMVYPLNAKQMVSGALVEVQAKSYQGGEWVSWWNGELYENGNEFDTQTGGWKLWGGSGFTKNSDYMSLYNQGSGYGCLISTTNQIDLSKYTTVNIEFEKTSGNNFGISVVEKTDPNPRFADFWDNALAVKDESAASGVSSLDISTVNKLCYISIGGIDWSAFAVKIKKVWLT